DGRTQFLVTNPIDRYLINAPMLPDLKKNPDGSLTIYIQKHSPGKDKESNWLPAPDGPIFIVMRLYWPKIEPPSILPLGHGTWKPPAIVNVDNLRALDKPRFGDKSLENLIRTDDRYGGDRLFHGPRGWGYWNHLEYPRPIQDPNLWPDTQSTYFIGQLELSAGATLTLHGAYPRALFPARALSLREQHLRLGRGRLGCGYRAGRGRDQSVSRRRRSADRGAQLPRPHRRGRSAERPGAARDEHALRRSEGRRRAGGAARVPLRHFHRWSRLGGVGRAGDRAGVSDLRGDARRRDEAHARRGRNQGGAPDGRRDAAADHGLAMGGACPLQG